jgi:hypothetical protein
MLVAVGGVTVPETVTAVLTETTEVEQVSC